ncbi:MAG: DUF427 domain-containing protein, partial [Chloroflexi bacterium]|nr:DUF427 domain-containing protein [Chloroflexota bacterium]
FPPDDVRFERLSAGPQTSVCEWKGDATYLSFDDARRRIENVAWRYPRPTPGYEAIAGYVAFYAGRVDEAWVGDERATPQPGDYYGGWITSRVVGPFKGGPGSFGW